MRVICINHDDFGGDVIPYGPADPQIGDECEVLNTVIGYANDGKENLCYDLVGYPLFLYDVRNFATLSDQPAEVIEELELTHA